MPFVSIRVIRAWVFRASGFLVRGHFGPQASPGTARQESPKRGRVFGRGLTANRSSLSAARRRILKKADHRCEPVRHLKTHSAADHIASPFSGTSSGPAVKQMSGVYVMAKRQAERVGHQGSGRAGSVVQCGNADVPGPRAGSAVALLLGTALRAAVGQREPVSTSCGRRSRSVS